MQTLQQIQEAKPGNKRAILTDLPEYLYSIPALASFFEPYGEVAMWIFEKIVVELCKWKYKKIKILASFFGQETLV